MRRVGRAEAAPQGRAVHRQYAVPPQIQKYSHGCKLQLGFSFECYVPHFGAHVIGPSPILLCSHNPMLLGLPLSPSWLNAWWFTCLCAADGGLHRGAHGHDLGARLGQGGRDVGREVADRLLPTANSLRGTTWQRPAGSEPDRLKKGSSHGSMHPFSCPASWQSFPAPGHEPYDSQTGCQGPGHPSMLPMQPGRMADMRARHQSSHLDYQASLLQGALHRSSRVQGLRKEIKSSGLKVRETSEC